MSTGAGKSLRVRRRRSHSSRRFSTTGSMTRKSTSLSALASPRAWEPKRITFDSAPAVSASSFPAWSIRSRETMADTVAEHPADDAIHWAAGRSGCQTGIEPRQSTGIRDRTRHHTDRCAEPKTRISSDWLRRESLYPAELSGPDFDRVEPGHGPPLGSTSAASRFSKSTRSWPRPAACFIARRSSTEQTATLTPSTSASGT